MRLPGGTSDTQPKAEDAPTSPLAAINGGREAVTKEGERFGWMVAVRRTELGLSQSDLAERMHTSRSHIARIEAGQSPSAETLERLAAILDGEPGVHGPGHSVARAGAIGSGAGTPRDPVARREPREPLDRRWLWAGLAAAVLIPLLVIIGGQLSGGDGDGDGGASPTQSLEAVSALPAVLATVEQAQEQAQAQAQAQARAAKAAAQEAKQARAEAILAERREAAAARKEEQAALAASDEESSESIPEPASEPVYSPPPAPSGGGSSGGGSSGGGSQGPPDVGHGIGGGG
jgi:transcriptional regulator with XRE-family HTH domain